MSWSQKPRNEARIMNVVTVQEHGHMLEDRVQGLYCRYLADKLEDKTGEFF